MYQAAQVWRQRLPKSRCYVDACWRQTLVVLRARVASAAAVLAPPPLPSVSAARLHVLLLPLPAGSVLLLCWLMTAKALLRQRRLAARRAAGLRRSRRHWRLGRPKPVVKRPTATLWR